MIPSLTDPRTPLAARLRLAGLALLPWLLTPGCGEPGADAGRSAAPTAVLRQGLITPTISGATVAQPTDWFTESETMRAWLEISGDDLTCLQSVVFHFDPNGDGKGLTGCGDKGNVPGEIDPRTERVFGACPLAGSEYASTGYAPTATLSYGGFHCPIKTVQVTSFPRVKINTLDPPRVVASSIQYWGGTSIFPSGCTPGANSSGCYYRDGNLMTIRWYPEADGNDPALISSVQVDFTPFGGGVKQAQYNADLRYWYASHQPVANTDVLGRVTLTVTGTNQQVTVRGASLWHVDLKTLVIKADGNGFPLYVTLAGASGANGTFLAGDTITVTWDDSASGDANLDDYARLVVDFSAVGGPAATTMVETAVGSDKWTASYKLLSGTLDMASAYLLLTLLDHGNHGLTGYPAHPLAVDTQSPSIVTGNLTLSGNTGTGGVFKDGNAITVQLDAGTVAPNADLIGVVASPVVTIAGQSVRLANDFALANQGNGVWRSSFTPTARVDASGLSFSVRAIDNAGNVGAALTPTFALDNTLPAGQASDLDIDPQTTARVGDTLRVQYTRNPALCPDTLVKVFFDFSAVGQGTVEGTPAGTDVWEASVPVVEGATLERSYTIVARPRDDAGNNGAIVSASQEIDAVSPVVALADVTMTNETRPGQPFRLNDTIRVRWNGAAVPDATAVRFDAPELGIVQGVAAGGNGSWTYTRALAANGYDGALRGALLTVADAAGNTGSTALGYEFVASFAVSEGDPWGTEGLPAYSCVEACALISGGQPGDWTCSTREGTDNRRAYLSGWGTSLYCSGAGAADTYKKPEAGGAYNCGATGCSYSAYVSDNCDEGSVNHCWKNSDLQVDLTAPTVTAGSITVGGNSGDDGSLKIGDRMVVSWDAAADGNADVTGVQLSFAELGGPVQAATRTGTVWRAEWTVGAGNADGLKQVLLTATDDLGNATTVRSLGFKFDNQLPTVSAGYPLTLVGNNGAPVKVGHRLTLSWPMGTIAGGVYTPFAGNADVHWLQGDFAAFGGGVLQGTPGAGASLVLTLDPVPTGSNDSTTARVPVTIRDDAGNQLLVNSPTLAVDNQPPTVSLARITVGGASGSGGTFRAGDTMTVTWNNNLGPVGDGNLDLASNTPVKVDFSALDGPVAQAATLLNGVYSASYLLSEGSRDAGGLVATVRVTDDAGYVVSTASNPFAVDRASPKLSLASVTLTNQSRPGQGLRVGDVAAVSWDPSRDANPLPYDFAQVNADFSAFGGSPRDLPRVGDLWSGSYTIALGALDGPAALTLRVVDDGGNARQVTTAPLAVDSEPPLIEAARLTIEGAGADAKFSPGETVTVRWAPASARPNLDVTTVSVVLTDFGCGTVGATHSDTGWTATCLVPAGVADNQTARAALTARDELDNSHLAYTPAVVVDGSGPTVTRITVAPLAGGRTKFRVGDTVTVSWDNSATGDNNGNSGTVRMDFSQFGGGTVNAGEAGATEVWSASYTLLAGTIDSGELATATVRVTATDPAGLPGSGLSAAQKVDNQPPTVSAAASHFSGASGLSSTFRIRDGLVAEWDAAYNGNSDVDSVQFDLRPLGLALLSGSRSGTLWRSQSQEISAGALDSDTATAEVAVVDDAGNRSAAASSTFRLDNQAPTVSAARITVEGASGSGGAYVIGDRLRVVWNNLATPGGDGNNDTFSALVADLTTLGGPAALALTDGGGTCDATAGDRKFSACHVLTEQALERTDARVTLTVTDNAGNATTTADDQALTVDLQRPVVGALADAVGSEGTPLQFIGTDDGRASSYRWTFGDGGSSSERNPAHTYVDNGSFAVVFRATDAAGNWAERAATARIGNVAPTVQAAVNQTLGEGGALTGFVVATFGDPGVVDTHSATIDWGDGQPAAAGTVDQAQRRVTGSHTFGSDGSYTVTVTVSDNGGGNGVGRFVVTVNNLAPVVATLTGNGSATPAIDEGGSVHFVASASDPGGDDQTLHYRWEFGDGTMDEGPGKSQVDHRYAADSSGEPGGRFTVTLTVSDSDQGKGTATLPVQVRNVAPVVQPLAAATGDEGSLLSLTVSASDAGDAVLGYAWDLDLDLDSSGDGNASNDRDAEGKTVQTRYADDKAQPYRVAVTVTDDDGLTARAEGAVTVRNVVPSASLQAAAAIPEGTVVNGVCSASALELVANLGDVGALDAAAGLTVVWDFGDGAAPRTDTQAHDPLRVEHLFGDDAQVGGAHSPYLVGLTVTDKDGGRTTTSRSFVVQNVAPLAVAGVSSGGAVITGSYSSPDGAQVQLTGSRSCDPGLVDRANLLYSWNFGDGSAVVEGRDVAHAFRIAGETTQYTVTLTVRDPQAATSTSTLLIKVDQQIPQPEILVDLSGEPREGDPLTFLGDVRNPVPGEEYEFVWQWGDGSADTAGELADHAFPDDGVFPVVLGARNSLGTIGWSQPLLVTVGNASPTVTLAQETPGEVGEGDAVPLLATVLDPGLNDTHQFAWTCDGDAGTVEGSGARIRCPAVQEGALRVQVAVTDDDGASAEAALELTVVNRAPMALTPANQFNVPEGTTLSLVGGGSDPGRLDQLRYQWTLPDGVTTVDGQTLDYRVPDEGEQALTLRVTDDGQPPLTSAPATVTVVSVNVAPRAALCGNALEAAGLDPEAPPAECLRQDVHGTEGEELTFTVLARDPGAGDTLRYSWNFTGREDGWESSEAGLETQRSHLFADEGHYTVRVRASDGDGGVAAAELTVEIGGAAPVVDAFPDAGGAEGSAIRLQVQAHDPGQADTLSYLWEFGDGQQAVTQTATVDHTWADSGEFPLQVTVSDDTGLFSRGTATVRVTNVAPTADAGEPQLTAEGGELTFSGSGSDVSPADRATLRFSWDFGDGQPPVEGAVVNHVFADEGSGRYDVVLTVTDADGGSASDTVWVQVSNVAPTLPALLDLRVEEGTPLSLAAPASDPGLSDVLSYRWDFGDGSDRLSGALPSVEHAWADDRAQPFSVEVRVDDGDQGWAERTLQVKVDNVAPRFAQEGELPEAATQGRSYTVALRGVDPGRQDVLTFQLEQGPAGMELTAGAAGAATLSWTPALDQIGERFPVSVLLSDGDGGDASLTWNVTVEAFVDSDGDGLPDTFEQAQDCLDATVADADLDPDDDGLSSADEYARDGSALRSDPCVDNRPGEPSLHAPARGAEVDTTTPELVVNNATDGDSGATYPEPLADLSPLHYEFQLGLALGSDAQELVATNVPQPQAGQAQEALRDRCAALTAEGEGGFTGWIVPAGVLLENATYQWRARACDGWGFGPWMAAGELIVNAAAEAPDAPTAVLPEEGERVATVSPVLVIGNSTDPDGDPLGYRFVVSAGDPVDPPDGPAEHTSALVPGGAGGRTSYDLASAGVALAEDVRHCFRAQAEDDGGLAGPWSPWRCFGVNAGNQAPEMPQPLTPTVQSWPLPERWYADEDVTVVRQDRPTLTFSGALDPDGELQLAHWVELDVQADFASAAYQASPDPRQPEAAPLLLAPGAAGSWETVTALAENALVFWRVRAWDGQTFGEPGVGVFLVDLANEAPYRPVAVSPEDGAAVEGQAELVVENPAEADPDRERVTYELVLAADPEFSTVLDSAESAPADDEPQLRWAPAQPLPEGTLWWRVRARDDEGATSEWSVPRSFHRQPQLCATVPAPVALPQATAGALAPGARPTLVLTNATGCAGQALRYEFELYAGDAAGEGLLVDASPQPVAADPSGSTGWTVTVRLGHPDRTTSYSWRARTVVDGQAGRSAWSESARFTVAPGWGTELDQEAVKLEGDGCALAGSGRGVGGEGLLAMLLLVAALARRRRRR